MKKNNTIKQFNRDDFIIEKHQVKYQGFFRLDEYKIRHKLFNQQWSELITREIFERGDAVVLIPFDPVNNTIVLLEQFRPGAMRTEQCPWMFELIAGMFSQDEQPVEVAIREAEEEANLVISAEQIKPVLNYLASPGGTSEKLYMYCALLDLSDFCDGSIAGLAEEHEDIKSHLMSLDAALELLESGKIMNAATIIGLQWLALNKDSLRFDDHSNNGK